MLRIDRALDVDPERLKRLVIDGHLCAAPLEQVIDVDDRS